MEHFQLVFWRLNQRNDYYLVITSIILHCLTITDSNHIIKSYNISNENDIPVIDSYVSSLHVLCASLSADRATVGFGTQVVSCQLTQLNLFSITSSSQRSTGQIH